MYTVYDRIFGDFPVKNAVYAPYIYMVLANPRHFLFLMAQCSQEYEAAWKYWHGAADATGSTPADIAEAYAFTSCVESGVEHSSSGLGHGSEGVCCVCVCVCVCYPFSFLCSKKCSLGNFW
jgi:hypothetical protein